MPKILEKIKDFFKGKLKCCAKKKEPKTEQKPEDQK